LKHFRPCLIINKARDERDYILGESIINVVQKYLVVDLEFLGVIPFDEKVHLSLKELTPYMRRFPETEVTHSIQSIAKKIGEKTTKFISSTEFKR
jgi:flagellar biosynthesis protein FlhG